MNDSTPPTGDQSNPNGPAPRAAGGFFDWVRSLAITRSDERWFAGVSGGLAAKAGIDPIIVRGVFIVLTVLGGPGILIYLAAWLLLPDSGSRIHAEEIVRGRASTGVVVVGIVFAAIIVLPLLFGITGSSLGGLWGWDLWGIPHWVSTLVSTLWWIALVGALVWFIVWVSIRASSSTQPGTPASGSSTDSSAATPFAGPATDRAAHPAADNAASPASEAGTKHDSTESTTSSEFAANSESLGAQASDWGTRVSQQATEWGNNMSKQAGDWGQHVGERTTEWSQKYAEQHEQRRLGAGHVILTLALALLAGGAAAAWASNGGLADLAPAGNASWHLVLTAGLVSALAVLAVSLILAGVRGKNSGWIGFLSACGVVALLFTAVLPQGTAVQPFGNRTLTSADTSHGLVMVAGNAHLDLSGLDAGHAEIEAGTGSTELTKDKAASAERSIWLVAGNSTVTLPQTRPVIVDVRILAGNIRESRNGASVSRVAGPLLARQISANTEGVAAEDITRVSVRVLAGNVRVLAPLAAEEIPTPIQESEQEAFRNLELEQQQRQLQEDRTELREQLQSIEWSLSEPGLSDSRQAALEEQLAQIETQIDSVDESLSRLAKESAR